MDKERRRELKKKGKAEVARRSAAVHAALAEANPAPIGSDEWVHNYRTGIDREKWLRQTLPILHRDILHERFVVWPDKANTWRPSWLGVTDDDKGPTRRHLLLNAVFDYLECEECGSAVPFPISEGRVVAIGACACGNIELGSDGYVLVRSISSVRPVRLIGKG